MEQGKIHIFTGDGHGKTPAALGEALYAASSGKNVVIVQFLKAKPETHLELCDSCGACARRCPMGAISFEDTSRVDNAE